MTALAARMIREHAKSEREVAPSMSEPAVASPSAGMHANNCLLARIDQHYQCAPNTTSGVFPGAKPIPSRLLDAVRPHLHGRIVFIGDSVSMEMWLSLVILLAQSIPLKCPPLDQLYKNQIGWGDTNLQCAASVAPRLEVCYGKAGMHVGHAFHSVPSVVSKLTRLFTNGAIVAEDVAVLNFGLHFTSSRTSLEQEAHRLAAWARAHPQELGGPRLVWRETSAQHPGLHEDFEPEGGKQEQRDAMFWFNAFRKTIDPAHTLSASPCVAHEEEATSTNKFNDVTGAILRHTMPILRAWELSRADWRTHLGTTTNRAAKVVQDCSHFCLDTSPSPRAWTIELLRLLAHGLPPSPPQPPPPPPPPPPPSPYHGPAFVAPEPMECTTPPAVLGQPHLNYSKHRSALDASGIPYGLLLSHDKPFSSAMLHEPTCPHAIFAADMARDVVRFGAHAQRRASSYSWGVAPALNGASPPPA